MPFLKDGPFCRLGINVWLPLGVLCLFASLLSAAENGQPAAPPRTPDAPKQQRVDPFAVPDGTPAELYAYIKGLDSEVPAQRDRRSVVEFIEKLAHARIAACEKILASEASTDEKRPAAAMLFSTTAQMALRFADPQAAKALGKLPVRLEKLGMPKIAAAVRATVLQIDLMASLQAAPGAPPLDEVIKRLKQFVAEERSAGSLQMVMMTINALLQTDRSAEALALCDWAAGTFARSQNRDVRSLLQIIRGTARRLRLPGHSMVIAGPLLDGRPYELAKQTGKVVLVQFWATWCQPCLQEIANVMKYYPLYHDRGFEVIGISIDEDKAALEEFLKKNKLPWPVMLDSQAKESNARRYGITGIPQLILVDRQGKVVSLDARGENLARQLEKLLGPAQKPKKDLADKR